MNGPVVGIPAVHAREHINISDDLIAPPGFEDSDDDFPAGPLAPRLALATSPNTGQPASKVPATPRHPGVVEATRRGRRDRQVIRRTMAVLQANPEVLAAAVRMVGRSDTSDLEGVVVDFLRSDQATVAGIRDVLALQGEDPFGLAVTLMGMERSALMAIWANLRLVGAAPASKLPAKDADAARAIQRALGQLTESARAILHSAAALVVGA